MSLARLVVTGALAVEAALLTRAGLDTRQGLEQVLALRQQLLADPVRAVATQCASEPRPPHGVVFCTQSLEWRASGEFMTVCAEPVPTTGDPRFKLTRHWRVTLACQWRAPVPLVLPPLVLAMAR